MKIIVVGSGKVGYTLSEQLNDEGHEITMIDIDGDRLQNISATLDIKGIIGNGTSYHIQKEAGVENADLLIAVTNHDEINMLSCLIAAGTQSRILRGNSLHTGRTRAFHVNKSRACGRRGNGAASSVFIGYRRRYILTGPR